MLNNAETQDCHALNEVIKKAQSGDSKSMKALGDYYVAVANTKDGTIEDKRLGIEWYERAAACNNYEAMLIIEELTGEKANRFSYSGFDIGVFIATVLCFLVFSNLAVKHNIHLLSVFLILASCLNLVMIMRGIYCYNEIINDPDLAKWFFSRKFVSIYMLVSEYLSVLALVAGFTLAIWGWDHDRIGILIIKILILVICLLLVSKEFSRIVKAKWKFIEHKPHINKIANDFGASRIQVELVLFSLKLLGCIIIVLLSAVMMS